MQAAATLQATLSETEDPVPDHFPAVLNLLNNIKTDEVLPRVVFPGTNDEKQLLSMCPVVHERVCVRVSVRERVSLSGRSGPRTCSA